MAGKYDAIAKRLTRTNDAFTEEYKQRLSARADELGLAGRSAAALATLYQELRARHDEVEAQESDVNLSVAAVERAMWAAFENDDVESIRTAAGRTVTVGWDISTRVVDKDALIAWVKENELDGSLTLYAATVQSITKERLLAGKEAPPGVAVGGYKKTRLT